MEGRLTGISYEISSRALTFHMALISYNQTKNSPSNNLNRNSEPQKQQVFQNARISEYIFTITRARPKIKNLGDV